MTTQQSMTLGKCAGSTTTLNNFMRHNSPNSLHATSLLKVTGCPYVAGFDSLWGSSILPFLYLHTHARDTECSKRTHIGATDKLWKLHGTAGFCTWFSKLWLIQTCKQLNTEKKRKLAFPGPWPKVSPLIDLLTTTGHTCKSSLAIFQRRSTLYI